jgi:prepilin-type N-terminal cleavage/methylation domain-containing protein
VPTINRPSRVRRPANGAGAGFTLMELLVALGLSAVVAVGLYSLSMVASQTFQQQQRISEIQLRLRSAMELIRADVQRAGYMSTPSSANDPMACPRSNVPVQGVRLIADAPNPTWQPAANVGINPVRLELTGNFASTDEYLVAGISGNTVFLQQQTLAYNRCCATSGAALENLFLNRVVRLRGSNGQMQFGQVISVSWQPSIGAVNPSLTLAQPPVVISGSAGCGIPGLGVGATIAPISTVQYSIQNAAATESNAYTGAAPFVEGKTDLVRVELMPTPTGPVPIAGTQRIVAEYAVDLDVAGVFDMAPVGAEQEPLLQRFAFGAVQNFNLLGTAGGGPAQPHRVRALSVRLSVRDRVQDPDYGWFVRDPARDPLTRFRVNLQTPGAARVRSATTEIALPTNAARNLR